jgi:hypothetical protein
MNQSTTSNKTIQLFNCKYDYTSKSINEFVGGSLLFMGAIISIFVIYKVLKELIE